MYSFPIMNSTYLLKARKPSLTEKGRLSIRLSLVKQAPYVYWKKTTSTHLVVASHALEP